MTASADLGVDAEVARLSKKYAPLARERDEAAVGVDECALAAAQLRIDAQYKNAAGESAV